MTSIQSNHHVKVCESLSISHKFSEYKKLEQLFSSAFDLFETQKGTYTAPSENKQKKKILCSIGLETV